MQTVHPASPTVEAGRHSLHSHFLLLGLREEQSQWVPWDPHVAHKMRRHRLWRAGTIRTPTVTPEREPPSGLHHEEKQLPGDLAMCVGLLTACMYVDHMHTMPVEAKDYVSSPGTTAADSWGLLCGWWEQKLGTLNHWAISPAPRTFKSM